MCLILGFTLFFKCISNLKGKEWISMSVHTEPGGIFGDVLFQPEIFPGNNNDISGRTKLLCQGISLNRQYRDHLKAASKRFNHYNI